MLVFESWDCLVNFLRDENLMQVPVIIGVKGDNYTLQVVDK